MTPAEPSVRGSGSATSPGPGCQGSVAPAGTGHGRVSFSGGQKLTGDQALSPSSTVRWTVK